MRFSGNNHDMSLNNMGVSLDFDLLCIVAGKRLPVSGIGQEQTDFITGTAIGGIRLFHQKLDHMASAVGKPFQRQDVMTLSILWRCSLS